MAYCVPNAMPKCVDILQASYPFATVAGGMTVQLLNGLDEGYSSWQRIGRTISSKSLGIDGFINMPAGGSVPNPALMRMLIVYDAQPNGAAPAYSDIIQSVAVGGFTSSGVADQRNVDTMDRFNVLFDRKFQMPEVKAAAVLPVGDDMTSDDHVFSLYIDLGELETKFKNPGAGVINIASGSLYMLLFDDSNTVAGGCYYLQASVRYLFYDR